MSTFSESEVRLIRGTSYPPTEFLVELIERCACSGEISSVNGWSNARCRPGAASALGRNHRLRSIRAVIAKVAGDRRQRVFVICVSAAAIRVCPLSP